MSGAASFVDGLLRGMEMRNRWDSRKRRDKIDAAHAEHQSYLRRRQKRQHEEEDAARSAAASAYADTMSSFDTPDSQPESQQVGKSEGGRVSTKSAPAQDSVSDAPARRSMRPTSFRETIDAANSDTLPTQQHGERLRFDLGPGAAPEVAGSEPKKPNTPDPMTDVAPSEDLARGGFSDVQPAVDAKDQEMRKHARNGAAPPRVMRRSMSRPATPDPAPQRPDPAPDALRSDSGRTAFADQAEKMGLNSQLTQLAQQADIATTELASRKDFQSGADLTEDDIQDRLEIIGMAEFHIKRQAQAAVPLPERPPLPDPNNPPPGRSPKMVRTANLVERARRMMSPLPVPAPDVGPDMGQPAVEGAELEANRMIQTALAEPDTAPVRPAPIAPAPTTAPNPAPLPRRGMMSTPRVPTQPDVLPIAPTPSAVPMAQEAPAPARPRLSMGQPVAATPGEVAASGQPAALDSAAEASKEAPATPAVTEAVAAANTVTRGMSIQNAPKATVARRARLANESFMDRYAKVGAPKMVEHYLRQGQPEKAAAFQAFIERSETKAAMSKWGDAVFAASIGDDQRFMDAMTEAYNARGYFDDGFEAVRAKSGLTRDAQGNIVGGKVTFRDTSTGQEFTQELDSYSDLYAMGVNLLSPEQVFEHGWSRIAAKEKRQAERLDLIQKETIKHDIANTKTDQERLEAAYKHLERDPAFIGMSAEEKEAAVSDYLSRFDARGRAVVQQPAQPDLSFPIF